MSVLDVIKFWAVTLSYGIMIILYIGKQCYIKGFRQVFYWKRWNRPHCLDDPRLGTHEFLTFKDVKIHYVASGPEDKPLMLFVHGFPEFWYSWRHQIIEFQKDYRVVAIDQRGYNRSSKPSNVEDYSLDKLLTDLEQIIYGLGHKSCVLVAHDWGGALAWVFGRHYANLVDKLIIMNAPPSPIFMDILKTSRKQQKMSWYMSFFQLPWLPEFAMKIDDFSIFDQMLAPETKPEMSDEDKNDSIAPYKYAFSQPGALSPPINYYRDRFRSSAALKTFVYDMNYTMPVLLIWGCRDLALDIAIPDAIESKAPKIDVIRIPDASHFVQTDAPDKVNRIMREWLSK